MIQDSKMDIRTHQIGTADFNRRCNFLKQVFQDRKKTTVVLTTLDEETIESLIPVNFTGQVVILGKKTNDDSGREVASLNPLDLLRHCGNEALLDMVLDSFGIAEPTFIPFPRSGLLGEPSWGLYSTQILKSIVRSQLLSANEAHLPTPSLFSVLNVFVKDDAPLRIADLLDRTRRSSDSVRTGNSPFNESTDLIEFHSADFQFLRCFLALSDEIRSVLLSLIQARVFPLYRPERAELLLSTSSSIWNADSNEGVLSNGGVLVIQCFSFEKSSGLLVPRLWLRSIVALWLSRPRKTNESTRDLEIVVDSPDFSKLEHEWLEETSRLSEVIVERSGDNDKVNVINQESDPLSSLDSDECIELSSMPIAIHHDPCNEGMQILSGGDRKEVIEAAISNIRDMNCGPTVVFDPTGQIHRAVIGDPGFANSDILRLDPFNVLGNESCSLNPFDVFDGFRQTDLLLHEAIDMLLDALPRPIERYWDASTSNLIRGGCQYIARVPEKTFSLEELWRVFHSDDVVYNLAVVLDTIGKRLPVDCYHSIAAFLQQGNTTRDRVLLEISMRIGAFGDKSIQNATARTTDGLLKKVASPGAVIFVALPAFLKEKYSSVVSLWLSSLHRTIGGTRSLFVLDQMDVTDLPPVFSLDNSKGLASPRVIFFANKNNTIPRATNHPDTEPNCRPVRLDLRESCLGFQNENRITFGPSIAAEGLLQKMPYGKALILGFSSSSISSPNLVRLVPSEISEGTHRFDPLRYLDKTSPLLSAESMLLADFMLPVPKEGTIHPYWAREGLFLLRGALQLLASSDRWPCTMPSLVELLCNGEVVHNLAKVLDEIGKTLPKECYGLIASFLQKGDAERTGIISEFAEFLVPLNVVQELNNACSSIPEFTAKNLSESDWTIQLVSKNPYRRSSIPKFKLWLFSLIRMCQITRTGNVQLVCDGFASSNILSSFPEVFDSPDFSVWSYWYSMEQLKSVLPTHWSQILQNADTIEVVGPVNPAVASDLSSSFRVSPTALDELKPFERRVIWSRNS
jgi:type IV secretory pathway TraG/TraD family ATPase VirD4